MFHLVTVDSLLLQRSLKSLLPLVLSTLLLTLPPVVEAGEENLQSLYNFQIRMAAQGSAEAMIKLGEMHEEGLGAVKSDDRAREWYQKARANGHSEAQNHLDNLDRKQERAAREKAAREQAEQDRAEKARVEKEQAEREQAMREQTEREREAEQAAAKAEAARREMTPEEKTRAREEAIRRAEEAYQQSLEKQLEKEKAESDALKRARNASSKKK